MFIVRILYGFAYDAAKSEFLIAVMWKTHDEDTFSYISQFSTSDYDWDNAVVFPYDIDTSFYQRAIHINGKLYWTGYRSVKVYEEVHYIMWYDTKSKNFIARDNDLIDGASPFYISNVEGKLGLYFVVL